MSSDSVFDISGAFGAAPMLLFCDHAAPTIPAPYNNLGLDERYLATHIAYDIGARDLTLSLAATFETRAVCSNFSRLLIDPNRAMDRDDHIPAVSDGVEIPGNQGLGNMERQARITRFFEPYHLALGQEVDAAAQTFDDPLIVSVHSFTPRLHATHEDRPWHIGILWAHDEPTARAFLAALADRAPDFLVGDNKPYDARGFNYTIDRHIKPLGLRHLTLEVRQDLLVDEDGVETMTRLLAGAIGDLMERETV